MRSDLNRIGASQAVRPKTVGEVEFVLEQLEHCLSKGARKAGDRLPNEDEIAATLEVGHTLVGDVIKVLDAAGVLEIRRGTGTFVRSGPEASLSQLLPNHPLDVGLRAP